MARSPDRPRSPRYTGTAVLDSAESDHRGQKAEDRWISLMRGERGAELHVGAGIPPLSPQR